MSFFVRGSLSAIVCLSLGISAPALAQKKYGPGVTDTEIKLGQSMPYSGPISAFSVIGKAETAYLTMINEKGGVNGRKINLISLDDGFSPPKALQQTRRFVEDEGVLANFSTVGAPQNVAIQGYLVEKQVPQLFVATGSSRWGDYANFPQTIGWQPAFSTEARLYVEYVLAEKPNAKFALLHQNDDGGRDYLAGVRRALGDKADTSLVSVRSYETSDATVDSHIIAFKASGADVFLNFSAPKFAAQAIRKAYDSGWYPLQIVYNASTSVTGVLEPAGLEKSVGLVSGAYLKSATDGQWAGDEGVNSYKAWMKAYYTDADVGDILNVYGYSLAQTLVYVLEQCGDDLTRENLVKQATNIKNLQLPMLVPGIKISTSPTDYFPIKAQRMQKFDGKQWVPFGAIIGQ